MKRVQYVWPPVTKSVIGIVITLFVLWFGPTVIAPLGEFRDAYLVLNAPYLPDTYAFWSVFTHAWFERDFMAVLFAGIAVWLFGAEIERNAGAAHFWKLIVVSIVISGLAVGGFQFLEPEVYRGWNAPLMALIAAYSRRNWSASLNFFFFPMTGRTLLIVIVGLNVGMALFAGLWLHVVADLVGVIVGVLMPRGGSLRRDLKTRWTIWKARRHLKLVRSPESKDVDRSKMN